MIPFAFFMRSLAVVALGLCAGCATRPELASIPDDNEQVPAVQSAMGFFDQPWDEGKVPGIEKGEHVDFGADIPHDVKQFPYPQTVALWVEKETEPKNISWYYLRRDSEKDSWRLTEGWKGTTKGDNWIRLFPSTKQN